MRSARFLLGFCCEFEIWGCVLLLSLQCRMKHRGKLGRVITAFGYTHIYTRRYIHHFYSSIIGQIFPNHWNYITHFGSLNVLKPNIDGTWYNSTHIDISFHAQICWSFWITIISTHLILQPDLSSGRPVQYYGCWCYGTLYRQVICSHDVDYVGKASSHGMPRGQLFDRVVSRVKLQKIHIYFRSLITIYNVNGVRYLDITMYSIHRLSLQLTVVVAVRPLCRNWACHGLQSGASRQQFTIYKRLHPFHSGCVLLLNVYLSWHLEGRLFV